MTQDPTEQEATGTADAAPADELEALRAEVEQLRAQSLVERADLDNQRKRLARSRPAWPTPRPTIRCAPGWS